MDVASAQVTTAVIMTLYPVDSGFSKFGTTPGGGRTKPTLLGWFIITSCK